MQPFRILSVELKQTVRKRRIVKHQLISKPRPRRKAKPMLYANQAEEWVMFASLYAADVARRRMPA